MPLSELPVISFQKADSIPASTAIFDQEGNVLIINLEKDNDYSGEFINSGLLCISLDSSMMIEDMEIKLSTSDIRRVPGLAFPQGIPAEVRFEESFVTTEKVSDLYADNDLSVIHLEYAKVSADDLIHLQVAGGIIFDVSLDNRLLGVWIKDIVAK